MTSIVKVTAHCTSDKEVVITVAVPGNLVAEQYVLQDGESKDVYIYDHRMVSSQERVKQVAGAPAASEMSVVE